VSHSSRGECHLATSPSTIQKVHWPLPARAPRQYRHRSYACSAKFPKRNLRLYPTLRTFYFRTGARRGFNLEAPNMAEWEKTAFKQNTHASGTFELLGKPTRIERSLRPAPLYAPLLQWRKHRLLSKAQHMRRHSARSVRKRSATFALSGEEEHPRNALA
jgi:hypothetical protein